ncbi:hypothetical protein [Dokdonella fugitiva]|jgi:hypothetical protein|uniref:hypothetical protein n=1 Tax=Dokdonella fugitiva TaxID=328517 RepID=UPI0015F9EACA|nr:hypothetical protein [Dokdonella fugitiva]MBA8882317.1 hypothetical protein [Dokdonella fugitiva]
MHSAHGPAATASSANAAPANRPRSHLRDVGSVATCSPRAAPAWADAQIFSRTFKSSDFDPYAPAGPGRGGGNLDVEKIGLQMPELIKGYVVRSIGPDKFHPDVILVGHRGSQGILVARGELMESLRGTTVDVSRLEERHRRLAMLCYVD